MSDEVLVKVEGVSKKFCRSLKRSMWYGVQDVSKELLGRAEQNNKLRRNEFWAVNDVSFELRRGECLGLIGPNGAGKSTLLKMLNGLMKPDIGEIRIRGQVGALIELGAGFNPILTARENIYVNGAVLGFSNAEIRKKFDAIVDFADIGKFVDTPVQNFSSGMQVRLGFSIAAQMEPDVLLIDEVLAVGDAAFRAKCIANMYSLLSRVAIIFVSHSMAQISRVCSKALYLDQSQPTEACTEVDLAIERYLGNCAISSSFFYENDFVKVHELLFQNRTRKQPDSELTLRFGETIQFSLGLEFKKKIQRATFMFTFYDLELRNVAECYSKGSGFTPDISPGRRNIELEISSLNLSPGKYTTQLTCALLDETGRRNEIIFIIRDLFTLSISGGFHTYAPTQYLGKWELN